MKPQPNGQSRIIAYGQDSVTGNAKPLIITETALDVNIVSPDPLPVSMDYVPIVSFPEMKTMDGALGQYLETIYGANDGSHSYIYTLDMDSSAAGALYVKFFTELDNYPVLGANPVLQYRLLPGVPRSPVLSAPLDLINGVYIAVQATPGALVANDFLAGVVYINFTWNYSTP